MKKCLCVRGLKNSPFRVVCPLAEQRKGSVSEICCKVYLVCILYQGKANRIFFLFLGCLEFPYKRLSLLCLSLLALQSSLPPLSPLHSPPQLNFCKNRSFLQVKSCVWLILLFCPKYSFRSFWQEYLTNISSWQLAEIQDTNFKCFNQHGF